MKRFSLIYGSIVIVFTVFVILTGLSEMTTQSIILYGLLFVLGIFHVLRGFGVLPENW